MNVETIKSLVQLSEISVGAIFPCYKFPLPNKIPSNSPILGTLNYKLIYKIKYFTIQLCQFQIIKKRKKICHHYFIGKTTFPVVNRSLVEEI